MNYTLQVFVLSRRPPEKNTCACRAWYRPTPLKPHLAAWVVRWFHWGRSCSLSKPDISLLLYSVPPPLCSPLLFSQLQGCSAPTFLQTCLEGRPADPSNLLGSWPPQIWPRTPIISTVKEAMGRSLEGCTSSRHSCKLRFLGYWCLCWRVWHEFGRSLRSYACRWVYWCGASISAYLSRLAPICRGVNHLHSTH